ncbi:beta strand repeat-containing protein [Sinimarinibacterium flocculans]|uniref:beta strand repeat-containing protein n=1 Tax=Sinimarinibacterium flocculans TaxID=985250 RepID=UPI003510E8EA
MRGLLKAVSLWLFSFVALGLSACGSDSTSLFVVSVQVTPATASVAPGESTQLQAKAVYSDGTETDVTAQAQWTTSNPSAVAVNKGTVIGVQQTAAPVTISATFDGVLGTATINVVHVVRIDVTPASASVAKGATLQLQAVATYSDDTTRNVTTQATWSSTNPGVATVSDAGTGKGLVTGVQQSATAVSIRANFDQVQGAASITVGAAEPVSVEVSPAAPTVAKGATTQLQAVAVYTDASTQDVTNAAQWTSNAPEVASVGNGAGNKGQVTGLVQRAAPVVVTAAFGGVDGSASVTVGAPVAIRLEVTPATLSLPNGTTQPMVATAVYSDNSTQNVTAQASWTSSAPGVVAVGDSGAEKGRVTAVAASATPATITAALEELEDTAEVTVSDAVLEEIQVTPADAQVPAGTTRQFTATGVYSDSSTQDLTGTVQWSSSDEQVATINASGLLSAVAASTEPVTLTATAGSISGTTDVTVTSGVLQAIWISPDSASIPRYGFKARFRAIGTYSDGATADLTEQVVWSTTAAAGVATISNNAGSRGVATSGNTTGSGDVTAAFNNITSIPATLTVTSAALQSIELQADADPEPETTLALALGSARNLRAIGVFSTGGGFLGGSSSSRQDITDSVTWSSCVPDEDPCELADNVATVSNATASKGRLVTQSPGAAVIGASITVNDGTTSTTRSSSLRLTVTDAVLQSLEVTPASRTLPGGFRAPFTARGTFTDGSVSDVTGGATWVTSNSNVVTISNVAGEQGVAKGGAAGSATVTAKWPSTAVEASASVTVTNDTLTGIAVTPANQTIKQGQTSAYTATGQFAGGGTLDITRFNGVTWSVSDSSVAAFGLDGADPNVAIGRAQGGPITVTARKTPPGSTTAVTGTTNLTVAGYALRRVFIVPKKDAGCSATAAAYEPMPRGYTRDFLACAEFYNDTVEDVTASATWSTQASALVTVGNGAANKGVATTATTATILEQGVIRAQHTVDGITEAGSYTVRIVPVDDLVIEADPDPTASLPAGSVVQFTALATFEGNSDVDVTEQATWVSSKASVATVSNVAGRRGEATVQTKPANEPPPPQTQITASFGGTSSNAVMITRAD